MAWTETIFLVVLVTGPTAAVLYCVLARFEKPPAQSEPSDYVRPVILPDKFILELQSSCPWCNGLKEPGNNAA